MSEPATFVTLQPEPSPAPVVIFKSDWLRPAVLIASLLIVIETLALELGGPSGLSLTAVFVASTVSSIAGFAFSALCGAMLFHVIERPLHVVQIMLVCSIVIQLLSVITLRNAIDWRHLSRFLCGGAVGLPVGVYLLTHLPTHLYLNCIGMFLIGYGLFMLLRRPRKAPLHSVTGDYAVGALSGITGGFIAFPGAFVTIWCGLKGWAKEQQRGVYQPFILIMQVAALGLISLVSAAQATYFFDPATISYVPGALLGTWCGLAIFRSLTDRQFARIVNLMLVASGLGLVS
jgi:uncharacterized membrane protein YfcA